jgi:hypothetical protein
MILALVRTYIWPNDVEEKLPRWLILRKIYIIQNISGMRHQKHLLR